MPLVLSVSAREPASIHTPTVEVCAHGECSVAIFSLISTLPLHQSYSKLTVRPFERVVVSVLTPFFVTGVANPLLSPDTTFGAARVRSPFVRFNANRRDAMGI